MNDTNKELFQFLLNVVPRHMSDVSNSMSQELVDIRKNLIRKARIITEFRYFLKRYISDSKTEKKIRKFEADFFNTPPYNSPLQTNSKQKTMRKSISIDQDFINTLLNNEEIINVASPKLVKKSKNSNNNYNDNECFYIDSETNFVSYLFCPKEATPFLGLSLISQNSSVIINSIHDDPSIFINTLIKNQTHPNYAHITQKIIPSLFGYFSSSEYLELASNFYIKLLANDNVTPEVAIPILSPFFNSPASYRFTEKLYTDFFQRIIYDKKEPDQQNDILFKSPKPIIMSASPSIEQIKFSEIESSTDPRILNARLLNSCILKAAPLLPPQFFKIFRQMRVKRWTLKDWYNLFFREFILISMNQWIRSIFCDDYVELLLNIMSRNFVTRRELANLFKSILKLKSVFEIPQLFHCFKSQSTLYLLSIRNMQLLVSFLSENKILPKSVDTNSFINVQPKYWYLSFWCNVYSRREQHVSNSSLIDIKKSSNNRLVFHSFENVRTLIDNEEKKSDSSQFQKEFGTLQSLAEKYDQTNSIEFMLSNAGNGDFYHFAERRCLSNLIDLADDFEEVMEMLRLKDSISSWKNLLQSNENMLVLSHIQMFERRMDVLQSRPTFIKQAVFLNKIDESKFKRFSDAFLEIGRDWDLIVHSPRFTTLKFSSSLSYAPSPTINKTEKKDKKTSNISSSKSEAVTKNVPKKVVKIINSASSPSLSSIGDSNIDDDETLNISEISSDTDDDDDEETNRVHFRERNKKQEKLRRISINCSNSDFDKNSENNICRSMSSDGLFNKSNNKVEPFSPLKHLPVSFFETLDLVSLINHVRLPEKFFIMMKVLEQIEFFSTQPKTDFSLLIILLQNIPGQILISMYVMLNVFAMREPNIFLLCSELERKRWLNFEQIVLKCASENMNFLTKLLNLQSAVQDEFNRWKDKNFKNW